MKNLKKLNKIFFLTFIIITAKYSFALEKKYNDKIGHYFLLEDIKKENLKDQLRVYENGNNIYFYNNVPVYTKVELKSIKKMDPANAHISRFLKNIIKFNQDVIEKKLDLIKDNSDVKNCNTDYYGALVVGLPEERLTFLNGLDKDSRKFLMKDYLQDPVNYNSCYDSAQVMADKIADQSSILFQSTSSTKPLDIMRSKPGYKPNKQAKRGLILVEHIKKAAELSAKENRAIYFRIHLGGHGFILVVTPHRVFHLESLAGSSYEGSLYKSIKEYDSNMHTIDHTIKSIIGMTQTNSISERKKAANAFGWNAPGIGILDYVQNKYTGDYKNVMAHRSNMDWVAYYLEDAEKIQTNFMNMIESNIEQVSKCYR